MFGELEIHHLPYVATDIAGCRGETSSNLRHMGPARPKSMRVGGGVWALALMTEISWPECFGTARPGAMY